MGRGGGHRVVHCPSLPPFPIGIDPPPGFSFRLSPLSSSPTLRSPPSSTYVCMCPLCLLTVFDACLIICPNLPLEYLPRCPFLKKYSAKPPCKPPCNPGIASTSSLQVPSGSIAPSVGPHLSESATPALGPPIPALGAPLLSPPGHTLEICPCARGKSV